MDIQLLKLETHALWDGSSKLNIGLTRLQREKQVRIDQMSDMKVASLASLEYE